MVRLDVSFCAIILHFFVVYCSGEVGIFDEYYTSDWGHQHLTFLDERREVQISIDQTSGGGFDSKHAYGFGYFKTSLKIPTNSRGIATTFYLTSVLDNEPGGNHDELDFELLGGNGPNYILNTNIFAQDNGHREQQFNLWFDPTSAFHEYAILWNSKQIVFYVDNTPIRVYENIEKIGVNYPKPPMYVHASLWNGTEWLGSPDWSRGPFYANYRDFEICGCVYNSSDPQKCESADGSWNAQRDWKLSEKEEELYKFIKNKYIGYDYCKAGDSRKNSSECQDVEVGAKLSRRRDEEDRAETGAANGATALGGAGAPLEARQLFCCSHQAPAPSPGAESLSPSERAGASSHGSASFADLYWASGFWAFYVLFGLRC